MNENLRKDNNLYEWKQTGGGGDSERLEQQYTCTQMIQYFKNMGTKNDKWTENILGYQKWHWTSLKFYRVWNNR